MLAYWHAINMISKYGNYVNIFGYPLIITSKKGNWNEQLKWIYKLSATGTIIGLNVVHIDIVISREITMTFTK